MKVAVLSESSADEAAIRILVDSLVGTETQGIPSLPLRSRGWPSVIRVLPSILKHLHYETDADALTIVADSDDSPTHQSTHDVPGGENDRCRFCQLRRVVSVETNRLRPVSGRSLIKTAVGLAVPAVEAWYLCGIDPRINEATWTRKLQSERITYTRRTLKEAVYGTDRPTLDIETQCAVAAAKRLASEISMLEKLFPDGFGPFAREVRSW